MGFGRPTNHLFCFVGFGRFSFTFLVALVAQSHPVNSWQWHASHVGSASWTYRDLRTLLRSTGFALNRHLFTQIILFLADDQTNFTVDTTAFALTSRFFLRHTLIFEKWTHHRLLLHWKILMDDSWELFTDPDEVSSIFSAEYFQPRAKALPLPSILSRVSAPRIRSPFQVTDLNSSSSSSCAPTRAPVRPSTVVSGLARPISELASVESLPFPDDGEHTVDHVGLVAPTFSHPPPASLLHDAVDTAETPEALHSADAAFCDDSSLRVHPKQSSNSTHRPSQAGSNLTRVRLASKSQIVWKLWSQFFSSLQSFSTVLQQMAQSQYMDEHAERFLNQYAATTLVRYMTSVLQFVQLCQVMRVSISDLTEAQLADLLICGSLARRSDGSGPKCSITIKALRWCCKQLGIQQFASAFGSLISSFERQKLPTDRKESLPFPLFILMKWERRVLQAQATIKEIIILGGFLLLCWSGLRFSDIQRTSLSTWFLDDRSLRGLTWRAKTCSTSTPFGVVLTGLLSQGNFTWVHRYLQALDHVYANQTAESVDFAIPAFHHQDTPVMPADAMTYAEALFHLRYFMQLPWSQSSHSCQVNPTSYTVHGLKATLLSWAAQADLSPEDRRMHGKHKPAQMSVQLYSRDDIIGSLRLQQALIDKISQGWRPSTPLGRAVRLHC